MDGRLAACVSPADDICSELDVDDGVDVDVEVSFLRDNALLRDVFSCASHSFQQLL